MAKKRFQTHAPTEIQTLEMANEAGVVTEFKMAEAIPGDVLLDYLSNANSENPGEMAQLVRSLLDAAISDEDLDRWHEYIREPSNHVDLNTLSEVAGWASEVLSGNPQPVSLPSGSG
jgi:hypothetical protein